MERAAEIFLAAGGVMPEGEGGEGNDDEVGFVGLTGGLGMVGSGWGSKQPSNTASSEAAAAGKDGASCGGEKSSTSSGIEPGMAVGVSGSGWGIGGGGRALVPVTPAASSAASVTEGAASIQE